MSRSLDSLREWMRGAPPPGPNLRHGITIVAGGKGGVGTSTVAALTSLAYARAGMRTLLIEAGSGGLPILFGLEGALPGIVDLARPGTRLVDLTHAVHPGLDLLPIGGWEVDEGPGSAERSMLLARTADLHPDYDRIVIDTGNRIDTVIAAATHGVERILVVSLADRISAAGTYAMLKAIHLHLPGVPSELVGNRVSDDDARHLSDTVGDATRNFLGVELGEALRLPADAEVARASATGRSLSGIHAGPAIEALDAWVRGTISPGTDWSMKYRTLRPTSDRTSRPGGPLRVG